MRANIILAVVVLNTNAAGAQSPWMTASELRATFAGKTISGRYADGARTFSEDYATGGTLTYREKGLAMGGRWTIKADTLCTFYDKAEGGCFRLRQSSANCYEFHAVAAPKATVPPPPPRAKAVDWDARGSIAGRAPTCADGAAV